jgi:hydroxypyruvate reductase
VRKHLSAVKGGRLALAAQPAAVVSLIISDVPGDDPGTVASGPTAPDPTTREQALAILNQYEVEVPPAVKAWLENPASETPKPGHPAFAKGKNRIIIIARARDALAAGGN